MLKQSASREKVPSNSHEESFEGLSSFVQTPLSSLTSPATLESEEPLELGEKWVLKDLKGKHKNICSLIAQGVQRKQVASICSVTPEYVSMLLRQPLCMEYIAKLNEAVDVQLQAMHGAAVEAIGETLREGNFEDKIKAARLQMEATGRVGPRVQAQSQPPSADRLEQLADRLLNLLGKQRERVYDVEAVEVEPVGNGASSPT